MQSMTHTGRWAELKRLVRAELQHLLTIKPSDRLWQMPFAAALATGLPLLAVNVKLVFNCVN